MIKWITYLNRIKIIKNCPKMLLDVLVLQLFLSIIKNWKFQVVIEY